MPESGDWEIEASGYSKQTGKYALKVEIDPLTRVLSEKGELSSEDEQLLKRGEYYDEYTVDVKADTTRAVMGATYQKSMLMGASEDDAKPRTVLALIDEREPAVRLLPLGDGFVRDVAMVNSREVVVVMQQHFTGSTSFPNRVTRAYPLRSLVRRLRLPDAAQDGDERDGGGGHDQSPKFLPMVRAASTSMTPR